MSESSFAGLGVAPSLVAALTSEGISDPFPVQTAVIPDATAGRDVWALAPTGSGKTLAFGLPMLMRSAPASPRRPTVLVLAPTRELADQIARALRPLGRAVGRRVSAVFGGVGYEPQRRALAKGVEILVACPGRLEDLIAGGDVSLAGVHAVVVDEADRMADMGFLPAVRRLVSATAEDRQVLLFSATADNALSALSASFQHEPVFHEVGERSAAATLARHLFWKVERADRTAHVALVAANVDRTIAFCRTRHGSDRVARQLGTLGITAEALHGGRSQSQRDRALRAFTDGRVQVLVATDVASRGIHVDAVGAVVHFDPPEDAAAYLHRSGRTARAGADGVVVSLVQPDQVRDTERLRADAGVDGLLVRPDVRELQVTVAAPVFAESDGALASATIGSDRAGVVSSYNRNRGWGFIRTRHGKELFVHHTNVRPGAPLRPGQSVEFSVGPGRKGDQALDVRPV